MVERREKLEKVKEGCKNNKLVGDNELGHGGVD